jgi:hypothetical protein
MPDSDAPTPPAAGSPVEALDADAESLRGPHSQLMAASVRALQRVSRMPPLVPANHGRTRPEGYGELASQKLEMTMAWSSALITYRFLIRATVEEHIRRRASELAGRCLQRRQSLLADTTKTEERAWLAQTAEDLGAFAATLRGLRSWATLVSRATPLVVGLAAASLGAESGYDAVVSAYETGKLLPLVLLLLGISIYILPFIVAPFRWKRSLLLGKECVLASSQPVEPTAYDSERTVFDGLGFGRRREVPIDKLAYAAGTLVFAGISWSYLDWYIIVALFGFAAMQIAIGLRRSPA